MSNRGRRSDGMAVRVAGCLTAIGITTSCTEPAAKVETPPPRVAASEARMESCGGQMPVGTMAAYFDRLDQQLKTSSGRIPVDFYTDSITLTEGGRTLRFRTAELGSHARRLPTLEEWREISRRGEASIRSAGYRGCYFSTGKAWFNTNWSDGRFALAGFDRDRVWTPD